MKICRFSVICLFLSIISLSCATIQNTTDREKKAVVYQNIQNELEKLDAFQCRDFLADYIRGNTYVTAKYKAERGVNWGTLKINSPFSASANLYINNYRYRRTIKDPREIYFLLYHMQTFLQFEAIGTIETRRRFNFWYW